MSANKTKKVKMATKSCPECDQQIPVACKSCPCGYVFISRKLLNAKVNERSSPTIADKLDSKRRRTERIRRDRIDSPLTNDMENRRRSRANSQSDPIRRGRGRPKTVGLKKQEEEKAGPTGYCYRCSHGGLIPGFIRTTTTLLYLNCLHESCAKAITVDNWTKLQPVTSHCFNSEKQEKEVDIYASLSDEKAFVFSVALAEINRKILGQTLIL